MTPVLRKVYAYITHGNLLLVFRQPDAPEAGIQIPGGTVETGEDCVTAVLREAAEETGLHPLRLHCFLGRRLFDLRPHGHDMIQERHFFHLLAPPVPPKTWRHFETTPHGGAARPIAFDFFWVDWPQRTPHRADNSEALLATRRWNS